MSVLRNEQVTILGGKNDHSLAQVRIRLLWAF
jgi:hypothetical protein